MVLFRRAKREQEQEQGGMAPGIPPLPAGVSLASLTPMQRLIHARRYDAVLSKYVRSKELNGLQDRAYQAKSGYAIGRVRGGDVVLFVSGSRNLTDWAFNVVDDFIPSAAQVVSNTTARRLTSLFVRSGCTVAVGHSRGGALVAKMNVPDYQKLGLDAAMRLAPKGRRSMMNLYQNQLLDRYIAQRGTNQKRYDLGKGKNYHFISRDESDRRPPLEPYAVARAAARLKNASRLKNMSRDPYEYGAVSDVVPGGPL